MKRLAAGIGLFAAGFAAGWAVRTRQTYVDMLRAVGALGLCLALASCGSSSGGSAPGPSGGSQQPRPAPPQPPVEAVHLPGSAVGVVVTNTAGDLSLMRDVADTGVGLVRLSHYMLAPGFRHRMRDDVAAAHDAGLEVYMDLQWWPPRDDFDVHEWALLVTEAMGDFPEVMHFSIANEPNERDFWPYGRDAYLQAFLVAQRIIHDHGRLVVGPDITMTGTDGYWYDWLEWFLEHAEPDILSIHPTGSPAEIAWAIQTLPGSMPIWVTELTHTTFAGRVQQMREVSRAQSRQGRWERTYWYHWYAEPTHPASIIRGSELERTLREIVR